MGTRASPAVLLEGRPASGHAPWEDYEPEHSDCAIWYRFDNPPFLDDGTLDPLSLIVMADTMPGAIGERVGHTDEQWWGPSVDLTVHLRQTPTPEDDGWLLVRFRTRVAAEGYLEEDGEIWGRSGRLLAQSRQLAVIL